MHTAVELMNPSVMSVLQSCGAAYKCLFYTAVELVGLSHVCNCLFHTAVELVMSKTVLHGRGADGSVCNCLFYIAVELVIIVCFTQRWS